MKITEKVRQLVESACRKKSNVYGYGAYSHHFVPVVGYAKKLAHKLNADIEIVELAGWLHDYAGVTSRALYANHHKHSAKMAGEILTKFGYPEERIRYVQECILSHRASKKVVPKTIEAKIIASADAMSHFDKVESLFYLAYISHGYGIDEGTEWVLSKLKRSWEKISLSEGKAMVRDKYQAIKTLAK